MKFKIIDFVDSPCMIICSPLKYFNVWLIMQIERGKESHLSGLWPSRFPRYLTSLNLLSLLKLSRTCDFQWYSERFRTLVGTEREMVRSPSLNTHLRTPQSLALTTEFCCNALSRSCSFRMKLIIAKLSQRMIYRKI